MVKVKLANGDWILGLSRMNIERLQEGKPIKVRNEETQIGCDIYIMAGETEDSIAKDLMTTFDQKTN